MQMVGEQRELRCGCEGVREGVGGGVVWTGEKQRQPRFRCVDVVGEQRELRCGHSERGGSGCGSVV